MAGSSACVHDKDECSTSYCEDNVRMLCSGRDGAGEGARSLGQNPCPADTRCVELAPEAKGDKRPVCMQEPTLACATQGDSACLKDTVASSCEQLPNGDLVWTHADCSAFQYSGSAPLVGYRCIRKTITEAQVPNRVVYECGYLDLCVGPNCPTP